MVIMKFMSSELLLVILMLNVLWVSMYLLLLMKSMSSRWLVNMLLKSCRVSVIGWVNMLVISLSMKMGGMRLVGSLDGMRDLKYLRNLCLWILI